MIIPPLPSYLNLHTLQQSLLQTLVSNIHSRKPTVRGIELIWFDGVPHRMYS